MSHHEGESGALPTEAVTTQQTVVLVQSMLVTWQVLDHLKEKRFGSSGPEDLALRKDAGCCKPDAGPCYVNKK